MDSSHLIGTERFTDGKGLSGLLNDIICKIFSPPDTKALNYRSLIDKVLSYSANSSVHPTYIPSPVWSSSGPISPVPGRGG